MPAADSSSLKLRVFITDIPFLKKKHVDLHYVCCYLAFQNQLFVLSQLPHAGKISISEFEFEFYHFESTNWLFAPKIQTIQS